LGWHFQSGTISPNYAEPAVTGVNGVLFEEQRDDLSPETVYGAVF